MCARNAFGAEGDEEAAGPARNHNSCDASSCGKQQALDHELPHEAGARCAERGPRRHFLNPCAGERQKQIGDVGTGRKEHQRDGAKQQPQRAARRAKHGFGIRHNGQRLDALLPGAQCRAAALDGGDLSGGRLGRDPRSESCDEPAQATA